MPVDEGCQVCRLNDLGNEQIEEPMDDPAEEMEEDALSGGVGKDSRVPDVRRCGRIGRRRLGSKSMSSLEELLDLDRFAARGES